MANIDRKELKQKCLEAYTRDVGRGVGRIDYDTMDSLNISTSQPALLRGPHRESPIKCLPLYPSDEGKSIIRIDGLVRGNVGIEIGKDVTIIGDIKTEPAKEIHVAEIPGQGYPPIDNRYISDALDGVYVIKDDNIIVPYFGGRLTYKIVDTVPDGVVGVYQNTKTISVHKEKPLLREFKFDDMEVKLPELNTKKEWIKLKRIIDSVLESE